jgi:hypothetical protein
MAEALQQREAALDRTVIVPTPPSAAKRGGAAGGTLPGA